MARERSSTKKVELPKAPTGISGFDDITYGGLPRGRPTLVAGGAGSGKTMFAMEFIVHGAMEYNEPGVYVTFEENVKDLKNNFASLGFDLEKLIEGKKIAVDHVFVERSQIEETGEYNLEALFIRLGYAIDSIGAKRVALDTIEVLFAGLKNDAIVRSELLRLFRWLKDRGISAVVTGEKGDKTLTRYGLEEYIADCVILLDNRVTNELATRRLRIIKYRGSRHGPDEYPFLIGKDGINIFPITSIKTDYKISKDRVSTGIKNFDKMFGGKGYFRGTSILITGTAGTGKSSFAAVYVDSACRRGEKCLYFAFEETQDQIIRNMSSIGLDLGQWVKKGLLKFHVTRPALQGLEMHLVMMEDDIKKYEPKNVVIDPITDLSAVGGGREVKSMITRLNDLMKAGGITILFTDLIRGDVNPEHPAMYISSLIDTWVLLRNFEFNGERNRGLTILKSRGMSHSNQIKEFVITDRGIELIQPYIGSAGVLMGSAKVSQEARDNAEALDTRRDVEHLRIKLEEKRRELDAKVSALKAEYKAEESELEKSLEQKEQDIEIMMKEREVMSMARKAE
ncbi:KaiC homolog [Methanocella paludicola SANAE]|uniref:non-specific serine/threonine protein kinase n=1 Tax=Methanocella paludicola (strain DSM 17711 / JCM 13418 / NBRC 101707 / SANAE) TaxID=304371 RepID=D1Z0I0_METPS|nr:circadian clock protein KaiC [Methanocella paludicola]BAI62202.1 KaiC homolog [Methanocella paludicola SANAE]